MKRIPLIIAGTLLSSHSLGQSIRVTLFGYDPCAETIIQLPYFGLLKDGVTYSVADSTGTLTLKEEGEYTLSYIIENIDTTQLGRVYSLRMTSANFSDTLSLVSVYPCLEPISDPDFIGYCCCGAKCEGEKVEYYSNGKIRLEGCFKAGIPQGELKFYNPNGHLRRIDKYNRSGKLVKRTLYDDNSPKNRGK
jgi:hypothetical protein